MFDQYIPQNGWERVDGGAFGGGNPLGGLLDRLFGSNSGGYGSSTGQNAIFQGIPFLEKLDNGDLLLLMLLYLLYRESGDEEWLILLALLVLLG